MTVFRARARAVDMLGRQQIANLPTALSELFKNAHDAYATMATAEYFRLNNLLVVSDDGVGMDRETFEQTWLTIATESKFERDATPRPAGMRTRVQLGEKGIGRFAIGALGTQVLVVSKRDHCRAIAALVNWKMFELPGIDLDAVPVGLIELHDHELTEQDVIVLKAPLVEAVGRFRLLHATGKWSQQLDEIEASIDELPDDPCRELPGLGSLGVTGTVFVVTSVPEDLAVEIGSPESNDEQLLRRTLHGFTDAWLGNATTPDFAVDFVDHRGGGDDESILMPQDFFEKRDFERADHHIYGDFDENGHFVGTIRVFDEGDADVDIKCPDSLRPRCGRFSFELGVVQGMASESRLAHEEFAEMRTKMRRLGGLYVYMDGIRVQPYGRPDVDYLEIEERRTFGAAHYFFSYRRMFGAVSLTSEENPGLKEKAGREGFTRSRSYSDFRQLLINLLKRLAAEYFRDDAPQGAAYDEGRRRLVRADKIRKEREKQAAKGRKRLRSQLAAAVEYLNDADFYQQSSAIVADLRTRLDSVDRLQQATREVAEARRALSELVEPLSFEDPEGFAPSASMRQDMMLVERGAVDVDESYVNPALDTVDALADAVEARLSASEADERERQQFASSKITEARSRVKDAEAEADGALSELTTNADSALRKLIADFDTRMVPLDRLGESESAGWIKAQAEFEDAVDSVTEDTRRSLKRFANLIRASDLVLTGNEPAPDELAAAADAEIVELRAQADDQLEYVQLGMALAVVDHEFRATVSNIRSDVRRVGSWAKKNPQLVSLYESLRRDFDHLDSYLTLLTPMQRRLRRSKTTIKGGDISRFLGELFLERLRVSGTEIQASRQFQSTEIHGYASTFYPVFINLVDNSLYWIQQDGPVASASIIELTTQGESLIYRDTGPGISKDISDRVFDFGFTMKPGGSGLGLAIASQVLDRAGWSLGLGDCEVGAEFVIRERKQPR